VLRQRAATAEESSQPEAAAIPAAHPDLGSEAAELVWPQAAPAASDAQVQRPEAAQAAARVAPAHAAAVPEAAAYAPAEPQREAAAVSVVTVEEPVAGAVQPGAAARPVAAAEVAVGAQDVALRLAAEPVAAERDAEPRPAAAGAELDAGPQPAARRLARDAAVDLAAGRAAAAWDGHRGRLRHPARPAPGPRPWAHFARKIRSSPIAAPTTRSLQAAGHEVCS